MTQDAKAFSIIYLGGAVMVLSSLGAQITKMQGRMLGHDVCRFVFCVIILFCVLLFVCEYSLLFVEILLVAEAMTRIMGRMVILI